MKRFTMAAAIAAGVVAMPASAQMVLAFDINGFNYAFKEAGGVAGFGGETHTGTVDWSFRPSPMTTIADVRVGSEGPFGTLTEVPLGAALDNFAGTLEFTSGAITGGSFTVTLDNGDTYSTDLQGDKGKISALTTGGFTLDGLTTEGAFNDDLFGAVDVSEFFAVQGMPGQLFGSLLKFRFSPDFSAAGTGDMEVFVVAVPLPAAAQAGLVTLVGAMGLGYMRRRR